MTPVRVEHPSNEDIIDVAAGRAFSLAIAEDGDVYAWGTPTQTRCPRTAAA